MIKNLNLKFVIEIYQQKDHDMFAKTIIPTSIMFASDTENSILLYEFYHT